jgi:Tol biopolymer transport system component/tRNA A-37 threonylcarbamoyl transferase component Bud32
MNDEQWRLAWDIFATAADLAGEERRSFLASLRTDPEVLDEVISMLEEAQTAALDRREPASRSGARFGRYEVGDMLSSGGMGEVYSAGDPELGRRVAIKFLSPETAASRPAVEQLIREAKAASALNHPHIITVYEVIRAENDVAIAMELVEGRSLRKFCGKPAEIAQVIEWGRQIAQALAAAHQRDIVHRDVKPENLMVRDDGILKVLDFGLAGHSDREAQKTSADSTGLRGTVNYMSPEQTRGELATSASDVFSLGVVLYELATGAHPFRCVSLLDTADAIAHAEPKPPSAVNRRIPESIDALLLRMLSKDARQRPTALEVDRQLSLAGLSKPARRATAVAWTAAISAVAISAVLAYAIRDRFFSRSEPQFLQLTRQVNENRVTAAAISPDGKTLLFATFGGPVHRRRMSDGNSGTLDTLKGLRIDRMVWFNDGSKVLINGSMAGDLDRYEPGIWVMTAEGGRLEQVASEAKNGVPSPDGLRIAYTSADGSLLSIASLSGGERRQIRSGGETISFSSLVWSPDGKRIAFQRMKYVPPAELGSDPGSFLAVRHYEYDYESVDVDTGQTAASAKDFIMQSACGLRDGSVLFLRNSLEEPFIYRLWKLRTDPQTGRLLDKPRLYTHADYELHQVSASADGKEVVAVRVVNGHPNVYVADLPPAGQYPRFTRVRRLTFTDADEYPHSWTADSRSIIFESDRNGNFDLFRQDIDQSDARALVISKEASVLAHVSPDGKWILYNQKHEGRWKLMRIPVNGGPAETILPEVGLQGEYHCSTRSTGRCVFRTVQNQQFLFRELDPVRGKGRELARTGWGPAIVGDWDISPDGSQIAIPNHDPRDARIRVVPLDDRGGTAERTVTIKTLRNLSGVVWAADGKGWYVSVNDARGLLFYVDLQGRILANLMESMSPSYAVPSPDGRHVAFMDWTVNANVWQVKGL